MTRSVVDTLLASDEPSVRWRVRVHVLGEAPDGRAIRRLRGQIRTSARARRLIDGHENLHTNVYYKWLGAHWVLLALAELGYPPGDAALAPIRDAVVRTWLAPHYLTKVPVVAGRHRRCGSQQGAALLSLVHLGLEGEDAARLVERLRHWQWPDGGWNCDRDPAARSSSVYETLLPMRALAAYGRAHGDAEATAAAHRAAEVLLERRLLFHRSDGRVIRSDWKRLHYPVYWRYDVLAALKGLAEAGLVRDERCRDALDVLQGKELPGGGWPVEARYHKGSGERRSSYDHVDWGDVDRHRMNEWVTADALAVLAAAGRLAQ